MNKQEMDEKIAEELKQFEPKELSDSERSMWRMWFNALRENDLAKESPYSGAVIVIKSLLDVLLQGKCASYENVIRSDARSIIIICTDPKEEIKMLISAAIAKYSILKGCIATETAIAQVPNNLLAVTRIDLSIPANAEG